MRTPRQQLGSKGEFLVFKALRDRGLDPLFSVDKHQGDIVCDSVRIEVKTSVQSKHDSAYRFCLRKAKFTCHLHSNVVCLVCIDVLEFVTYFVIPVSALANQSHICMTSTNSPKYAKYRVSRKELAKCLLNVSSV